MKDKIKTKWVIRLPLGAELLVKVGDVVKQGQVMIRADNLEIRSYNYASIVNVIGPDRLLELNSRFKNTLVREGDLFCIKNGIFGKKICFPNDGKFLEIDEFGSLKLEMVVDGKKEIKAPVNSKVSKIEDDKVVLDFWVKEFKGEGLIEGKTWGSGVLKEINGLDQLGPDMDGKILFTNNTDSTFLLKADVVGVVGIVTNNKDGDLKTKLPVLYVNDEVWSLLMKQKKEEERFLLNSIMGRLLLVLE